MNELTVLQHGDFGRIRIEVRNGEPWFVAKDVCDALGIRFHRDAISRLDDDERGSVLLDTLGGRQQLAVVNESGLYNLIFQSRKLQAKSFKKWVTSEVLPTIRKTGKYELHRKASAVPTGISLLDMIGTLLDKNDRRQIAREMKVPRRAVDEVLQGRGTNKRLMTACYEMAMENKKMLVGMYDTIRNDIGLLIN